MRRWLLVRSLWLLVTLLGVTFVTFVVLDCSPVDRAEIEAMKARQSDAYVDVAHRNEAIQKLRIDYGMIDPVTREPLPLWRRYSAWLGNALTLRLAGPGEDHAALWRRLAQALPVTMLLGGLSLLLALAIGLPAGVWLGRRVGSRRERVWSSLMLAAIGVPEFLLATLLLLTFSVVWVQWFPAGTLRSAGAEHWTFVWQVLDFVWHLTLPVLVMSIGPIVMVSRFVRDAVARASAAPFVTNLHALGVDPNIVARRMLRHGAVPVATLAGGLLPMLVGGSIIVENMFSLDGLGHLAFRAVLGQDQAVVMALVLLTSFVTLIALLVSDLLHRLVDARVRLTD
jgi:ABC-type dipeptide/oligopeptide/nickel transport system permease component